jgi:glycolate oxidase
MNGEVLHLGGKHLDSDLYDVMGLFTGSEGLLGVITEATVRILPKPQSARGLLLGFPTVEDAGDCVAAIIAKGIIPAGLEMMDQASINAVEDFQSCGYPREVGSLLICELDGPRAEVDDLVEEVSAIANSCGASLVRTSSSEAERLQFWKGRKNAFPAVGAIGPDYLCMDGTIPRSQLSNVLARMEQLSAEFGLRIANVFHAGDGNLHPLILYDASVPGQIDSAEALGAKVLLTCVEVGGVLTGEHGVGVEKRDLMCSMFNDDDLDQQHKLKVAFDPMLRLNPGKVFPTLHRCAEHGKMHVHGSKVAFPDLPRF